MTGWKRAAVWLLRLVIGGVFVMSGFVKMIDPWGFVFKIEEYLAVWEMMQPRTLVLAGALLLSGYEFVLGALLAMGCYKRVAPWGLMLTMFVMLPLTLYIWIADPVSDCGCFGDFWKISNGATFMKNVAIVAGLICLIRWNGRLRESLFNPAIQWMVGAWVSLYILIVGLYGYNVQPMLDFRSFPVGTDLKAESAGGDDLEYVFVYEKDGVRREFDIDHIPDSTWTFVDRIEPEAYRTESDKAVLAVYDGEDEVTEDVIAESGPEILLVIPEPLRADISYSYTINEIAEYADSVGIPMAGLLGTGPEGVDRWRDVSMAEYPCYTVEDTSLKELARGNMSVVMLDNGIIMSKTTVGVLDPAAVESPLSEELFIAELSGYGSGVLKWLNIIFGGVLLLLYMFQGLIIAIRLKFKGKYRQKHAKNS
ncbi:MAG: DoxX family protein [Muribaculaceae bacterium]|nr:DoxX family protein [Muribaculaceae bacterium]